MVFLLLVIADAWAGALGRRAVGGAIARENNTIQELQYYGLSGLYYILYYIVLCITGPWW